MKFVIIFITVCAFAPTSSAGPDFIDLKSPKISTSGLITKAQQQAQPIVADQSWNISSENSQALLTAKIGQSVLLDDFPQVFSYPSNQQQAEPASSILKLKRYEVFSPNARIFLISENERQEIPRPELHAFAAIGAGVGILVDINTGAVTGLYNLDGISMDITGNLQSGLEFRQTKTSSGTNGSTYQCGMTMAQQPGDPFASVKEALSSRSAAILNTNTPAYQTTIAVDTDMEWMAGKGNNTATAMNYINTLFVNMNVFMERDLSLRLLIGTTYLRANSDPIPPEPDISQYLTDFGEYWRVNETAVDRDFAVLLSGENIGSNSFSGIAWLNQYCQKGFQFSNRTAGSYSVNRIGSNASTGFISQFVGHELGHNLGSPHTHCYDPVVDTCFNNEAGCYAGAVSCPTGGKGTIMSYCHFGGPNGASCGLSNSDFHPTVAGLISSRLLANSPSCITPLAQSGPVFEDSFE